MVHEIPEKYQLVRSKEPRARVFEILQSQLFSWQLAMQNIPMYKILMLVGASYSLQRWEKFSCKHLSEVLNFELEGVDWGPRPPSLPNFEMTAAGARKNIFDRPHQTMRAGKPYLSMTSTCS